MFRAAGADTPAIRTRSQISRFLKTTYIMLITESALRRIIKEEIDEETKNKLLQIYFNSATQGLHFAEMMRDESIQSPIQSLMEKHLAVIKRFIQYAEENWSVSYDWYAGGDPNFDKTLRAHSDAVFDLTRPNIKVADIFMKVFINAWNYYDDVASGLRQDDEHAWKALKDWAGV